MVRLNPLPAGGPYELVAEAPSGTAVARDVHIGEVWVCSGQSNMEWKLSASDSEGRENVSSEIPAIRVLTVANRARLSRQESAEGEWKICSPDSIPDFSAVAGWFGRYLHEDLKVPIGLICNAWGGTRVEAWTSREALVQDPRGIDEVRHYESWVYRSDDRPEGYISFSEWERKGAPQDTGNTGLDEGWASAIFDDSAWPTMELPARWQDHGHPGSGVFWFRRSVKVPADWAGQDLELRLGAIDKHDDTWVNDERVGGLSWEAGPNSWCTARVYRVPARLIQADGNVTIAVRARSHVFHGGFISGANEMQLVLADKKGEGVPISGTWRYRVEQDWGVVTPPGTIWGEGNHNSPYILFESRVAPLIPYAMRGVIWYQGESNASEARDYRRMFPLMIRDWRRAWGQGDFAFLFVQLANYMQASENPGQSNWAELRDAQAAALSEPNTGMAVAIDVGEALDIHPKDKKSVGYRLARWALAETYGCSGVPSGPLYHAATAECDRIRIRFRNAAGLRTRDSGPVRRIAIAGLDRVFLWAESKVEGETLVVWHPKIPQPAAVRYAWSDNPEGCNLVNGVDLPAAPFRTDSW